jgi:cytochrome P450
LLWGRKRFLQACRRRYGDVVRLRTLFGPPFVAVFDPDLIAELFRAPPERARAGAANAASEPLHGGHSLLLLDGAEHLRHRRLLTPAFHGERLRTYERAIRDATDRQIDTWPVGERFALSASMHELTLDVIIRAVFGIEDRARAAPLVREVRAMLSAGRNGFERHRAAVAGHLRGEIAARREAPELEARPDALSGLIAAGREDEERALTDDELRDELVTLLVAGHETTAGALTWALALLLDHPGALARLRASLAEGETDYLDAVISEALRIRPVVTGLGRLVAEGPMAIGGFEVPPGAEVSPAIDVVHGSAATHPAPRRFRPERFLGAERPPGGSWIPFGGGTRRCLGASFAEFEMRVVIARVLERCELRAAGSLQRGRRRRVTPPTRAAFARALRRGRRTSPSGGAPTVLTRPPRKVEPSSGPVGSTVVPLPRAGRAR